VSSRELGLFVRSVGQLFVTVNTVVRAVVLPSDSACRNSFSTGVSPRHSFASVGPRREKQKTSARFVPSYPDGHRCGRERLVERKSAVIPFSGCAGRRVRSSALQEELRAEPLLLHIERTQLRWHGHLSHARCSGHVQPEGGPGHTGGTMSLSQRGNASGLPGGAGGDLMVLKRIQDHKKVPAGNQEKCDIVLLPRTPVHCVDFHPT
ncbi:hypothetical protein ILYODFUR_035171, partial [Ilyodon furcidens]